MAAVSRNCKRYVILHIAFIYIVSCIITYYSSMAKHLLLVFIVIYSHASFAQKQNMLDSANVWQYEIIGPTGLEKYTKHDFQRLYFGIDTVINTESCREIYMHSDVYWAEIPSGQKKPAGTSDRLIGFISQDATFEKIFFTDLGGNRTVLYDFSRQVGDSVFLSDCRFTVIDIDTVMINGFPHRVWEYDNYDTAAAQPGFNHFIIEGIGSTLNFFEPLHCYLPLSYDGHGDLHCFTNNGSNPVLNKMIDGFDNTSSCLLSVGESRHATKLQVRVVPNPATANSFIEFPGHITGHIAIYDITGRLTAQEKLSHTTSYSLANKLPCSGFYSYKLVAADGGIATGRFAYAN